MISLQRLGAPGCRPAPRSGRAVAVEVDVQHHDRRATGRIPRRTADYRPSARSRSGACVSAGSTARSSSDEIRSDAVSPSVSGGSERRSRCAWRSAHFGYRSNSSGRATHTTRSGRPHAPVHQVIDEVEQGPVAPVEVLEHQHESGSEASASRNRRHAANGSVRSAPSSPPPRRPAARAATDPGDLAVSSTTAFTARRAWPRLPGRVRLEDAGVRLDHLAERPEAHASP